MDNRNLDKTLVLVTYQFPYLPGEYFIESEVEYLCREYKNVLVFPMRRAWTLKRYETRELSSPIDVVPLGTNRLDFLGALLRAVVEAPVLVWRYRTRWAGHPSVPDSSLRQWLVTAIKISLAKTVLSRFLRSHTTDKLIFYCYWRMEAAGALALLKERGSIRAFFSRAHGSDIYISRRYPFESVVHEQATAVFPVSENGLSYLSKSKGFSNRNIAVQRLGISLPDRLSEPSLDRLVRVVTCSNIIPLKRVELIAAYLGQLPLEIEWTHFGDGSSLPRVEDEISRFDDRHRARLMGRVPNGVVLDYYGTHRIDVFINLSETEGVPVSIMEALAYGIPVLATNVGGTSEILDATCGYLAPVDCTYETFEKGFGHLLTPEHRSALRLNARRRAEELCDAQRNYPQNYRVMATLLEDDGM